jgi:hypothetical protein
VFENLGLKEKGLKEKGWKVGEETEGVRSGVGRWGSEVGVEVRGAFGEARQWRRWEGTAEFV